MINRVDVDAANQFAVTAADDKTVRIWSLPDGHLQRVLRLPVDYEDIGTAYAVAISPDGSTVAVGGWTGQSSQNIFLFDRASGALKQRLSDIPNVVLHLAYSGDGRRLAAALGGRNGIRVFDTVNDYRLLPSDTKYDDQVYSVQFDRAGRLVTASYDALVRLYKADQYESPVARFNWIAHRPFSAAFSPDGTRIAVGDTDSHDVIILSGSDLTQPFNPDVTGIPKSGTLSKVGWSRDGHFLYAGGKWSVNNKRPVRRWDDGGRGPYVDIPTAPNTIMQMVGLNSGSMLVASIHAVSLIGRDARVTTLQPMGVLDLTSGGAHRLTVSSDGGVIQIDSWEPPHAYRFALADRVVKIDPPQDKALEAPITENQGIHVTNWDSSRTPTVNGVGIKLMTNEFARSLAFVPGTQRFVLGAEWSLHLFDQFGHDVWPEDIRVPGETWHVNATNDKRLVIAAYDDGTIRWHRLSDGKELLALFIHPDGQRWVVWTPQGYYDASLGADEMIGWHVNHGYDRAPDFYPVSQFRSRFYRPDVVQRVLHTLDVDEAVRQADGAANRPTTKAAPIGSSLKPVVEIHSPKDQTAIDRTELQLTYSVHMPSPDEVLSVEVLIDGVKTPDVEQPLVTTGDTRAGLLTITVPRRDCLISVIAYNKNGPGEPASVHVKWRGPGTDPKLTLYVLAIGISNYKANNVSLHFAAKDADDFVTLAKKQEGGLYEKVIAHPTHGSLRDEEATRDAILDELDWIKRAVTNTNDVALIFLSGHGVTTPDQHYRFLPYDYDPDRVERTTISDSELQDYLTKIGGKKIFFFDTCYSGAILGAKAINTQANVDKFANELKAAENGIVVFTSSTGNELSQEKDEWENGAFAKAVVEGLRGDAGRSDTPVIMITDLQGYVSRRVKELTNGNQKPMMAMPKTVEDFPISVRLQ
jgi:WD40 repeat protein